MPGTVLAPPPSIMSISNIAAGPDTDTRAGNLLGHRLFGGRGAAKWRGVVRWAGACFNAFQHVMQ